jgi:hypothetical protein
MLRRYPWLSLLMLFMVFGSTAYAVGQALAGDWQVLGPSDPDTVLYNVPPPTEAEVSEVRKHLAPKIHMDELTVDG